MYYRNFCIYLRALCSMLFAAETGSSGLQVNLFSCKHAVRIVLLDAVGIVVENLLYQEKYVIARKTLLNFFLRKF